MAFHSTDNTDIGFDSKVHTFYKGDTNVIYAERLVVDRCGSPNTRHLYRFESLID